MKVSKIMLGIAHDYWGTRAAPWLADRRMGVVGGNAQPILPTLKARFGLADADAVEAVLLAGNYSVCRRTFG